MFLQALVNKSVHKANQLITFKELICIYQHLQYMQLIMSLVQPQVLWRHVKVGRHVFSCQSLLLSSTVLNNNDTNLSHGGRFN